MAAVDQPTPPNLGNQTKAQFLALPDWSVPATNQTGADGEPLPDTWTAMELCVVALLYRLIRDNFAYENDAWACRVSTPLLQKVEALQANLQARATDNPGQAITETLLNSFAIQLPTQLFTCDGTTADGITGSLTTLINVDSPATPHPVFHVVRANGGASTPGTALYGLRVTQNRWYYTDTNSAAYQENELICSVNLTPQWNEDSSIGSKAVILKVADYLTTTETGATKRMQFEFGLHDAGTGFDAAAHGTDRVLYLRYFDAGDVEVIAYAQVNSEAVGIGMGREITLGFARIENGGTYDVSFYVNGVFINTVAGLAVPSAGTGTDIRLHVGANQLGSNWVGGPINNVYYLANPGLDQTLTNNLMHAVYRAGAGYLQP